MNPFKVAEHSFRERFYRFSPHTRIAKANMPSIERSFYLLKPALSPLFFSIIERSVLMALVFYYKDILGKVTTQRTQQFLAFLCYRKNPGQCSACSVARKIEIAFPETCRFLTIQSLEFQEIWQKNSSETM